MSFHSFGDIEDMASIRVPDQPGYRSLMIMTGGADMASFRLPEALAEMMVETFKQHRDFVAPRAEPVLVPIRRVEGY